MNCIKKSYSNSNVTTVSLFGSFQSMPSWGVSRGKNRIDTGTEVNSVVVAMRVPCHMKTVMDVQSFVL